jgi:alkaline phosphatase
MRIYKEFLVTAIAIVMVFYLGAADENAKGWPENIKNVIVMIPDGCDETVQTMARWYKGKKLQVDKMQNGVVMQHMANSVITGSAAAATAFAGGKKTTVRFLGVGPDDKLYPNLSIYKPKDMAPPYAPFATVLEAAKRKGKATGIAATSRVTHATPAAFACHIHDRGMDNEIMEHMVYNNVDVVFGGGFRHLIPTDWGYTTSFGALWTGKRKDGENLFQVLTDRGYQFVDNRDDMLALSSGKVWGMFANSHMQPDMDRKHFAPTEPSLAEMVKKAIELLSQDPDGFFLMVEGSQVDWAGHNNDPVYMVRDFLAFDRAVKEAVNFAKQDGQTVVMAYPDHNTGGMKIGHYDTPMTYTETTVEDLVKPLKKMKMTSGGLVSTLPDPYTEADIIHAVQKYWKIKLTSDQVQEILDYSSQVGLAYSLAYIVSRDHTMIGWTTHGHNGETVPVWMYGAAPPVGTIDNTFLATMAAKYMGANLKRITERLYVDVSTVTKKYELDMSDPMNPVLKIGVVDIPISKDYMIIKGKRGVQLPGVAVYAPRTGKVYVSQQALNRALNLMP